MSYCLALLESVRLCFEPRRIVLLRYFLSLTMMYWLLCYDAGLHDCRGMLVFSLVIHTYHTVSSMVSKKYMYELKERASA